MRLQKLVISLLLISVLAFAGGEQEEKKDTVTIMVWDGTIEDTPAFNYIEETLNVDIVLRTFPHAERDTAIPLMIAAGGDLPDIFPAFISGTGHTMVGLAERGVILPWSDFMDAGKMPLTVKKFAEFPSTQNQMTDLDTGEIYMMPDMYQNEMWTFSEVYRSDWAEKLGIYKAPETAVEFRDLLRAIVNGDPNGNGKKDEVGWTNWYSGVKWMKMFMRWFDLPAADYSLSTIDNLYWSIQKGEEVCFAPTTDRFKAMLTYLNGLWEEGLIFPEQFNMTGDKWRALIANNTLGAYAVWPNGVVNNINKVRLIDRNAMLKLFPYPIAPQFMGPDDRVFARRGPVSHGWALSASGANTETAVRVMDFIFGDEDFVLVAEFGIEGVHHAIDANGDPYYIGEWAEMDATERTKALGSGLACLPHEYRNIDAQLQFDNEPLNNDYKAYMKSIDHIIKPPTLWQMNNVEQEMAKEVMRLIRTYVDETVTRFVVGSKPFSEWDEYVATVNKEAGAEIEACRDMYQEYFEKNVREFY